MATLRLRKGYTIKLQGDCESKDVVDVPRPTRVAVTPARITGYKTRPLVKEGESVKAGTPVCYEKTHERIVCTAPVSGKIERVVRGLRRRVEAIVIACDGKDKAEKIAIPKDLSSKDAVLAPILQAGLFPFFTQRPFATLPSATQFPRDIFISAYDSAPLGYDWDVLLKGNETAFQKGLHVLDALTDGSVHLTAKAQDKGEGKSSFNGYDDVLFHDVRGKHPAGNVGVHIHHIAPINDPHEVIWTTTPLAVILIGRLFKEGRLNAETIVKVAGTRAPKKGYFRSILGAEAQTFFTTPPVSNTRIISGNVLTGTHIEGDYAFLDPRETLLTLIPEATEPEFLGWLSPGITKESKSRTFLSSLLPFKNLSVDTNVGGGKRAFVATGIYEDVVPMDILPVHLAKAALAGDIEEMEALGILELAEEDVALCEYICPSKTEFQSIVRQGLDAVRDDIT